jgi:hypothetical protein
MLKTKNLLIAALLTFAVAAPMNGFAAEKKAETKTAVKAAKPKPYPLDKCIVSDEKLGEMGDPYVFVKDGQQIKLCCKSCYKDFKKDPTKYLKKLDAEKKKAKAAKANAETKK